MAGLKSVVRRPLVPRPLVPCAAPMSRPILASELSLTMFIDTLVVVAVATELL